MPRCPLALLLTTCVSYSKTQQMLLCPLERDTAALYTLHLKLTWGTVWCNFTRMATELFHLFLAASNMCIVREREHILLYNVSFLLGTLAKIRSPSLLIFQQRSIPPNSRNPLSGSN